ncbi:hypothetical protein [Novosphingobium sp. MBES04]|nr:hypothetical protein [Novosphingobium sp. MBES04]
MADDFPVLDPQSCEWCGGDFLPDDTTGDACAECAEDLSRGDED